MAPLCRLEVAEDEERDERKPEGTETEQHIAMAANLYTRCVCVCNSQLHNSYGKGGGGGCDLPPPEHFFKFLLILSI